MRAYKATQFIKTALISFLIANSLQGASFAAEPSSKEEEISRKVYLIEKYDFNPDYKYGVLHTLMDYFTNYGEYPASLDDLIKHMQEKTGHTIRVDDPFTNSEDNGTKEAKDRQFIYKRIGINGFVLCSVGPNGGYNEFKNDDIIRCYYRNEKVPLEKFQDQNPS